MNQNAKSLPEDHEETESLSRYIRPTAPAPDLEIPSARATVVTLGVLFVSACVIGAAIYGLAQTRFWQVAPVLLQRGLNR